MWRKLQILAVSFKTRNPKTGDLAKSEDPDEMLHHAALLCGIASGLRKKNAKTKIDLQRKKFNIF